MNPTRRELLLAGLGALIAGCSTRATSPSLHRPPPSWSIDPAAPRSASRAPVHHAPAPSAPPAAPSAPTLPGVNSRSRWTRTGPVKARVNPMNGISRITIHHEGSKTFWATDYKSTAARIESVRSYHVNERKYGDIAYHYIIDRSGQVWEGRDVRYQGAHVSKQNEHNLGIMCLGNFDKQSPSSAQLSALQRTVAALASRHGIARSRIYTHRELGPTTCPGSSLQPRIAAMRSGGKFA